MQIKKDCEELEDVPTITVLNCYSRKGKPFINDLEALEVIQLFVNTGEFIRDDFEISQIYGQFHTIHPEQHDEDREPNKVVCPKCTATVTEGNFCGKCGCKMVTVCNCWVLHKPYDCGHSKCPG